MAESAFELDQTSGSFTQLTTAPYRLEPYGTTTYQAATKYSGAGALNATQAASGALLTYRSDGTALSGAAGVPTFVDFFYFAAGANSSSVAPIVGTFWFTTNIMVGISSLGTLCGLTDGNVLVSATGNTSVPTNEWIRIAYRLQHVGTPTQLGEVRMFKGANLLGTVPDATIAGGQQGNVGFNYIGFGHSTGNLTNAFIDSILMNDTTWPVRGAPPPPPPTPKGWWITKPG